MNKRVGYRIGTIFLAGVLLLLLTGFAKQEKLPITSLESLNQPDIKIALGPDSPQASSLQRDYPDARLLVYNDMVQAYTEVANGRIDACLGPRLEMEIAMQNGISGVRLLEENYDTNIIAVGISPVSKIPDFQEKLNRFIEEVRTDGTLDEMYERWVIRGEDQMPDIPQAENPALTVYVGTTGTCMPYSYYVGTELAGYDIELAHRFASWLGAKLEFKIYDFGGIVAAAVAGDVDCIMSNLFYTEEKSESISFSDPLFKVEMTMMVQDNSQGGAGSETDVITSVEQLHGKKIGSATGTTYDEIVRGRLPDVTFSYYNTYTDMVKALESGKIAAFACDEPILTSIRASNSHVVMLPEYLDTFEYGFIFTKSEAGSALCSQMSEFIRDMRDSGELERLKDKWLLGNTDDAELPDIGALKESNGRLTLAVDLLNPPFDFMRGNGAAGYEIELVLRFCDRFGYALEIKDMEFSAVLAAVQTGKADLGSGTISITGERAETMNFSEPHYSGGTVLAVLEAKPVARQSAGNGMYSDMDQLDGKNIGIQTGTIFKPYVEARLPHARLSYYNTTTDIISALETGKIDAFPIDESLLKTICRENDNLTWVDEYLDEVEVGMVFAKTDTGQKYCREINEWLQELRQDGELEQLMRAWLDSAGQGMPVPDYESLPATNGTLTLATDGALVPFSYIADGKLTGYEIDLATRFCRARGYGLNVRMMNFDGILMAVQNGQVDFSASGFAITEERKESVLFSDSYYHSGTVMAVKKRVEKVSGLDTFFTGLRESFNKTFIREGRWRLFISGVLTTLLITVLSILCGTTLGFVVFMLCRNGNPVANRITRFCVWLVQGMPIVVLLMVLYYVIFGSVSISGIVVSVIGFTLTFGSAVYGLLRMGVSAVDQGQYEAACALGYSNLHTFFRIILPQALPHVFPAYQGEIVGLIKATAVVGYIAVQDLTKMGDIVRSRTYEAFFPLIAVTVIYFILEGALGILIRGIGRNLNSRHRKPAKILKGVKTDDPD